jgi:hypothetical protein
MLYRRVDQLQTLSVCVRAANEVSRVDRRKVVGMCELKEEEKRREMGDVI